MKNLTFVFVAVLLCLASFSYSQGYKNFKVAVYCRAYEVERMSDMDWLTAVWDTLLKQVHVDKIYLKTHRDLLIVDDGTIEKAKHFFEEREVELPIPLMKVIIFKLFAILNPKTGRK